MLSAKEVQGWLLAGSSAEIRDAYACLSSCVRCSGVELRGTIIHSLKCTGTGEVCNQCRLHRKLELRKERRRQTAASKKLHPNAPLNKIAKKKLSLALQHKRKETNKLLANFST